LTKGIWPVSAGVMTRKACAEVCVRTEGCSAFDVRKPGGSHHSTCFIHHWCSWQI